MSPYPPYDRRPWIHCLYFRDNLVTCRPISSILDRNQGRSHQSGWSGFNRTTFRPIGDIFGGGIVLVIRKYTVHTLWSINSQEN